MSPTTIDIPIQRLPHGADLDLPRYATPAAAGLDLLAAVGADLVLTPGGRALVPTGIAIAVPPGFEGQVRPRSGLALKSGITVLNSPGTIDADYRGEIGVVLVNFGHAPFTVRRGDRIAQLVIAPCLHAEWREATTLPSTQRGGGGFGSTDAPREPGS